MNIFALDTCPIKSAQFMCDKHIVKMAIEVAQILSTAHRYLDGIHSVEIINGRKKKVWTLSDDRENVLYKTTHINHPSTVWARQTNNNYNWLFCHFVAILDEYTHRYGKIHATSRLVDYLRNTPRNIPVGYLQSFACAMDSKYIISDNSVDNYRNYYKVGKGHLHSWKNREIPFFI